MIASRDTVFEGNTLICMIDDEPVDGEVLYLTDGGAEICYLEGYKSRNHLVPWGDIVARYDIKMPRISVCDGVYEGNFLEFTPDDRTKDTGSA